MQEAGAPNNVDLADEAERYLRTVDVFRVAGHDPVWRPEHAAEPAAAEREGLDAAPHLRRPEG